jgi:hypothetical protein
MTQAEFGRLVWPDAPAYGVKTVTAIEHGMEPSLLALLQIGAVMDGKERRAVIDLLRRKLGPGALKILRVAAAEAA